MKKFLLPFLFLPLVASAEFRPGDYYYRGEAMAPLPYVPQPFAAYVSSDGSGSSGTWNPLTGSGGTPISYVPQAYGMYYSTDGSGAAGTWAPWNGVAGSGTVAAGTGIAYYSTPGGTAVGGSGSIVGPVCGQGVAAPAACLTYQAALQAITSTNMILQWPIFEGSGTTLTDTSGNGRNGTISAGPTWSGLFLDFRSNSGNVALPGSVTTFRRLDFGILIPAPQSGGVQSGDFNTYGDYSAFPANPSPFCGTNSTGLCLIAAALSGSDVSIRGGWASPRISNYFAPFQPSGGAFPLNGLTSGWHAITFLCGSSSDGTYDTLYIDGTPQVMSFFARACPASAPTGTYNLGGDSHATGTFYRGQIGYFAVKSQLETSTIYRDAQNILAFLAQKGAQVGLSTRNGSRTPTLTCYGDSRTNGYLSGVPLCTAVTNNGLTSGWNTISYGSNGLNAADAVSAIDNTVSSTVSTVGRTVVATLLGTNDSPTSCTSANFIASELQGIIQKIKRQGAQVIIGTEVSATTKDTCLLTVLNPVIRANWQAWGADSMVDYGDGVMGATGAYANPTAACGGSNCYNADGLHWSAAGTNYDGTLLANVHAELVGSSEANPNAYSTATYTTLPKDGYVRYTGTAIAAWTLVDCIGFSKPRVIYNPTAYPITITPVNSETIDGLTAKTIPSYTTWTYQPIPNAAGTAGCSWVSSAVPLARGFISANTGTLTSVGIGSQYSPSKVVANGTLENIVGTASVLTGCTTNPTFTLEDCGTSAGACSSPTALASVTISAANTLTDGTITSAPLTAGHYLAWETTAGVCTSASISGSAEWKSN
jgi:lysophospholipase L1-like esterase